MNVIVVNVVTSCIEIETFKRYFLAYCYNLQNHSNVIILKNYINKCQKNIKNILTKAKMKNIYCEYVNSLC